MNVTAAVAVSEAAPWWVVPLVSVVAAAISAIAVIVVRRIRGPVTIQDLWAENRSLRTDLTSLESKVDGLLASRADQDRIIRVLGEGVDALSTGIDRLEVKPTFTEREHEAIDAAKALRSDDTVWSTSPLRKKD